MGTLVLYCLLGITIVAALANAWIGVLAYYTTALWSPQSIWYWVFGDIRVSLYISLATFAGLAIAVVSKRVDFSLLRDKQNFWLLVLVVFLNLSCFINPYGLNTSSSSALNSKYVLSVFNKIVLFYAVSVLLIDTPRKVYYLALIIVATTIYHTYWANNQYLSGLMTSSRLAGPVGLAGGSIYVDENTYALLFVTGVPFLYFVGHLQKRMWLKYGLWLIIPFSWHAVFLTGSRGGLLGLGCITLTIGWQSRSKIVGSMVLLGLIVAFVWQGGSVMKERSATINNYEEESSAQARLTSWKYGTEMIVRYPLTGVGLGNYMRAYADLTDEKTHVAHNTFFQFASESGIIAGIAYLTLCFGGLKQFFNKTPSREIVFAAHPFLRSIHQAVFVSLLGFFVCSIFLSLTNYEIFYYLLLLNLTLKNVQRKESYNLIAQGVYQQVWHGDAIQEMEKYHPTDN